MDFLGKSYPGSSCLGGTQDIPRPPGRVDKYVSGAKFGFLDYCCLCVMLGCCLCDVFVCVVDFDFVVFVQKTTRKSYTGAFPGCPGMSWVSEVKTLHFF